MVVTTPQEVSVLDVGRALKFVESMKKKLLGIVENMSYMVCPHCGGKIELFGKGGGEKLAKEFSATLLGQIPFDPKVVSNSDRGETIITHMRGSIVEKSFRDLVKKIVEEVER